MTQEAKWKFALRCAASDGLPYRSFWVALVVGSALNLINQGGAIITWSGIDWLKIALTYCVPYLVCTYGGVSSQLARIPGDAAVRDQ